MCGIVGYVGAQRARARCLLESLQRLEYRGYDSAGIAVIGRRPGAPAPQRRQAGQPGAALAASPLSGSIGIGHTRWATHGGPPNRTPTPTLTAPGASCSSTTASSRTTCPSGRSCWHEGHVFASETDTEVLVHLIEQEYEDLAGRSLAEATRRALARIKGAHAIVVMSTYEPDRIIAARLGNAGGVVVGQGDGEMFLASDMPAILQYTRQHVLPGQPRDGRGDGSRRLLHGP